MGTWNGFIWDGPYHGGGDFETRKRSQKGVLDRWEEHCRMLSQIGLGS